MKMRFPFQIRNVVFIFQTQTRCRSVETQNGTFDTSTCDTFDLRLPTLDSDTKIDFRQCRSSEVPTPVSERPALDFCRNQHRQCAWSTSVHQSSHCVRKMHFIPQYLSLRISCSRMLQHWNNSHRVKILVLHVWLYKYISHFAFHKFHNIYIYIYIYWKIYNTYNYLIINKYIYRD